MALITDLPTQASPASSDYLITDNGSTTSKSTIGNVKTSMGMGTLSEVQTNINSNSSVTITLSGTTQAVLITQGAYATQRGLYIIGSTTTSTYSAANVLSASDITVSNSNMTYTIASSRNSTTYVRILVFAGSVSV